MKPPRPSLHIAAGLAGWERQWDDLVDAASLPSPFLRSWWLEGTKRAGGNFLLVVEHDRLLGGLAVEQGRTLGLPVVRLMGSPGQLCPDHLDLVTAPEHADRSVGMIRSWLGRPGPRLLDFRGVRAGSQLRAAVPGPVHERPEAPAPWAPLTAGPDAYLGLLPSRFRRQVRRASERLGSVGVTYRANRGSAAVRSLGALRRLHLAQWGSRSQFLPEFERFVAGCRGAALADEVVVHELATDTEAVAMLVAFEVAGRVSLYQSARQLDDRFREATSVLLTTAIVDAATRGFSEVDFLRGDEAYKARYAPARRQVVRLVAGNGALTGLVAGGVRIADQTRARAERWVGTVRAERRGS